MQHTLAWAGLFQDAAEAVPELPFSFVYDGRHLGDVVAAWQQEHAQRNLDGGRVEHTLLYTDPQTGLQVRAMVIVYAEQHAADWTLWLTNTGQVDTPLLEQFDALDLVAATPRPGDGPVVLHRLNGSSCAVDDWLPFDDPLPPASRIEFAPRDGKSSKGACPFFHLDWGTGGVLTAIGWSGQWAASVEQDADGRLRVRAGMQDVHLTLRPGETIRSPRILQLFWSRDDRDGPISADEPYNQFRQLMLRHVMPQRDGAPVAPPIAHLSTAFYELNDSTAANVLSHLESIQGLGFEYFWLDAYWTRDGFPNGMGNYGLPLQLAEPADRFPGGLKPIGDAAHAAGLKFLVWFEPERVAAGTHIARHYPNWVISPDGDGSGLFNLGIPEAREYLTRYFIAAIQHYGVDCLRIDFNIDPLPYWQHLDRADPSRAGAAQIHYVEGLYQMWDEVRAACPGLFIDNCASGGMRIDLETCARSIPLWRTDATIDPLFKRDFDQAALQNQVMTAGLSWYLPFHTSGMMGATPYWFRSGFNAGISFCEDCRPDGYPRELLKQAIAEGKRLRRYYAGNLHWLSPVTTSAEDWCVLQYHRPAEGDGLLIAFRRHRSPRDRFSCALREIDPAARYAVTLAYDFEPGAPVQMAGSDLQQLVIEIADCPGSVVVEYRLN